MGKMRPMSNRSTKTRVYENLKGVDFSVDPSLVDPSRSPWAVNLISDDGGDPMKRPGYEVLVDIEEEITAGRIITDDTDRKVYNLWSYMGTDGTRRCIARIGKSLYSYKDNVLTSLDHGLSEGKRTGGYFMRSVNSEGFYILNETEYLKYSVAEEVETVEEVEPYVPQIFTNRNPVGGGTVLEAINLLTSWRKEGFLGDSTSTAYLLSGQVSTTKVVDEIETTDPYKYIKVLVKNASGIYEKTTAHTLSADRKTITFSAVHAPIVTGEENVLVEYYNDAADGRSNILKCTAVAMYTGQSGSDRVFVAGNTDATLNNYVYYSALGNPAYFPDTNYMLVGTNDTAVAGFMNIGQNLAIVKFDNSQDATIFLTYTSTDSSGNVIYKILQSVSGVGAVSKNCFAQLEDEPLFLTPDGVYAITNSVNSSDTYDKAAQPRSSLLNTRLTAESNLAGACGCEWKNYMLIFINTRVYILDGRQKTYTSQNSEEYAYESYYWEDIPASCCLSEGEELMFGSTDGKLCRFKTDRDDMTSFNDNGNTISVEWRTPDDAAGALQYFKNLNKKGSLVSCGAAPRSSMEIYLSADGNPEELIGTETIDVFSWDLFDFERGITFDSRETPREHHFKKRKTKYKRLQVIVKNSRLDEFFELHSIIISYDLKGYSKNRRY